MFLTLDVVNKVNTIVKDSHNRSVSGYKAVVDREILNIDKLISVRSIQLEEKYPKHEMFGPHDISAIENQQLCLLTFSLGNVTSEKIVICPFEQMQVMLPRSYK